MHRTKLQAKVDKHYPKYAKFASIGERMPLFFRLLHPKIDAACETRYCFEKAEAGTAHNPENGKKLLSRNILLESQIETAPDGILIVDEKRMSVASNRQFADMFGIPKAIMDTHDDKKMIKYVLNRMVDPVLFISTTERLYNNPLEKTRDELQLKDGRVFERYSAPLIDSSNKVLGRIWYFKDITNRKNAEKTLQNAMNVAIEANADKDRFFNLIAHDLKSPFQGILGFLNMLKDDYSTLSDEERKNFISIALKSSEKAFAFLEQMLEWNRLHNGRMDGETININVRSAVNLAISPLLSAAAKKRITLQINTDHEMVFAQEMLLGRVIANLVSNAIKFTPSDGRGEITISATHTGDGLVRITVSDNGMGMENEMLSVIFTNRLISTIGTDGETGTGLGLPMVRTMVEKMGGTITATSEKGKGSIFTFTLPAAQKEAVLPQ